MRGTPEIGTRPLSPEDGDGAKRVVRFWQEAGRDRWFAKDGAFDELCRDRFLAMYGAARDGRLSGWEASAEGALALVILLDQLPRNMFRNTPAAWDTDREALAIAERGVERGFDRTIAPDLRELFYLPFMHRRVWRLKPDQ